MKTRVAAVCLVLVGACVCQGAIVYSDNFDRGSLNGGSHTYTTTVAGGDGAASVDNNLLNLTNDGSSSVNDDGRVYVTTPTSAFDSSYHSQLNQNAGLVTWIFNMRQIRSDPSGFNDNYYGVAFVIGATSSDLLQADGYAVVLGQSGSTDPIRLVKFAGGLDANSSLTDLIPAASPLNDIGADFLSLKVTYDPSSDSWSLYGRNDGASFANPGSGTLTFVGSKADNSYTGGTLSHFWVLWDYSTVASQEALFDNFSINVVPEPAEWGLYSAIGLLGIGGLRLWRQHRAAKGANR